MKTSSKSKSVKQPLFIVGGFVMTTVVVLCIVVCITIIKTYGSSIGIKQLSIFATLSCVTVMAAAGQFMLCEYMSKGDVKTSIVLLCFMSVSIGVIMAYCNAGAFEDVLPRVVLYYAYALISGVLFAGITFGLLNISTMITISLFGSAIRKEESTNE